MFCLVLNLLVSSDFTCVKNKDAEYGDQPHNALGTPNEIKNYYFCPADEEMFKKIKQTYNSN